MRSYTMVNNPLKPQLSDEVYKFLLHNNLLREKGIRDYVIRQRFKELKGNYPTYIIIEKLQDEYAYLQYDTIRKIIYQRPEVKKADFSMI